MSACSFKTIKFAHYVWTDYHLHLLVPWSMLGILPAGRTDRPLKCITCRGYFPFPNGSMASNGKSNLLLNCGIMEFSLHRLSVWWDITTSIWMVVTSKIIKDGSSWQAYSAVWECILFENFCFMKVYYTLLFHLVLVWLSICIGEANFNWHF